MKIILHYGTAKTGTTSLQNSLFSSRNLLRDHGVLYPQCPVFKTNHHALTGLFKQKSEINSRFIKIFGNYDNLQKNAQRSWEAIKKQVSISKPHVIILSSEYFFTTMTQRGQEIFRDKLYEITDNIQPCVYIREPAGRCLSSLQEHSRRGSKSLMPAGMLKIRKPLETIEDVFNAMPIVCPFDHMQLERGDLVNDFVSRFISDYVDPSIIQSRRLNQTFSAEAMAIMHLYHTNNHPHEEGIYTSDMGVLEKLIRFYEMRQGKVNKPKLQPHVAAEINASAVDYLWLREKYDIQFENIDYNNIDGNGAANLKLSNKIEDIVEVNNDRRNEITNHIISSLMKNKRRIQTSNAQHRRSVKSS